MKWISTVLLVIAGVMIAFKVPHFEYAFAVFFAGHAVLQVVFVISKETALLAANTVFWIIDAVGIYRWLL